MLILTPFRNSAYKIVKAIKLCLGNSSIVSHWDKFQDEFGGDPGALDENEEEEVEEEERRKTKN